MPSTLSKPKTRDEARDELLQQTEPIRLVESLRNHDIDMNFVVGCLKEIAQDGAKTGQITALKMFIGMFVNAGMDYDLTSRVGRVVGPPSGTLELIDGFISEEKISVTDITRHGSFLKETADAEDSSEAQVEDEGRERDRGDTGEEHATSGES